MKTLLILTTLLFSGLALPSDHCTSEIDESGYLIIHCPELRFHYVFDPQDVTVDPRGVATIELETMNYKRGE